MRYLRALAAVAVFVVSGAWGAGSSLADTAVYADGCGVFTVPAGVSSVRADAVGPAGGSSDWNVGGTGDEVAATLDYLTPGQHLTVCALPGGGSAGSAAGAGGGASGVAFGSFTAPAIIAAGGGGAGGFAGAGRGGDAGFPNGDQGGSSACGASGGGGATQASFGFGGDGADSGGTGEASTQFIPATGGHGALSSGGGGGGGWFSGGGGGGAACGGGGGGGSDFCALSTHVSDCVFTRGVGTEHRVGTGPGQAHVVLTYASTVPAPVAHPVVLLTRTATIDRHHRTTVALNCPAAAGTCEITYALWAKIARRSVRIASGRTLLHAGNNDLRLAIARSRTIDRALRHGLATRLHVYSRETDGRLSYVAPALRLGSRRR